MRFTAITLFPEMFDATKQYGVVGRAIKDKRITLDCINPRDFTKDKHRSVDDRPYGGGPGMLMTIEPLTASLKSIVDVNIDERSKVIYLSPQGRKLDQNLVKELSQQQHLILISGRYEGVDQRFIDESVDIEISLGDFVLSGGEIASLAVIDTIARQIDGVLGHSESVIEDSFEDGLLDHPHYTRPEVYKNKKVPAVLLSGNHKEIERWRLKQRLGITWQKRPDLLMNKKLTNEEKLLLEEYKKEFKNIKKSFRI
ncbi:MAG: tRNA (guanosine(37)-N1)-methyltransferase TrmD [Kangiella sp.]|nr:MAG: tRNA (guanosine(37)-N1)-methyltransferase TrmD [Kangiella sp.]